MMIPFSSLVQAKKLITQGKLFFNANLCWNRSLSSSSSTDPGDDPPSGKPAILQHQVKTSGLKFQNVLNYLEKSVPLFVGDVNDEESREFIQTLSRVRSSLESVTEFHQRVDKIDDETPIDSQKFLRDRFLQSRSSILADGSISCLIYPDLGLWDKILPEKFLLDFIVANILGVLDYLDNGENLQYSRSPSLGHDYIEESRSSNQQQKKTNYITIAYGWNHYLIDLEQFENPYQALWQIFKFLFEQSSASMLKNPFPMGILSTLPRNDCMYGYKFLNELDLQKLRQSKLLVSIEKFDMIPQKTDDVERDHRISLMAKQILLSNEENIGNRWYDKSLQLVFVLNKNSDQLYSHGLCFEQSHAKIESILQLMDHSIKFLTKFKPKVEGEYESRDIQFKKLQIFNSKSKRLNEIINQATNHFAMEKYLNICSDRHFQLSMLQFVDYGMDMLEKEFNLSADDWIQVSFNLALYKLSGKVRPCYQRYLPNGDAAETWFQCLNQEMVDFFHEPNDRQKLLLALESLKFHREILMPENSSPKEPNNIESILLVYQNLAKFPDLDIDPATMTNLEALFKLKSLRRLRKSTAQITTLKPGQNYYDWHLVTNGHPYYDHRINLTAHLASNHMHFALTLLRCGNDQQLRTITVDRILYEFDQSLRQIKNLFQN
uniref:Carnitine O-acetyltransferase-like n=1 Tax=Dermatophagoides pteronyssinus TaxID=6956 RepID=A0A6P6XST6_DERPT|nr:carnitine O-acetyltransferase-like [Dermatophagoides pteronyssinus]